MKIEKENFKGALRDLRNSLDRFERMFEEKQLDKREISSEMFAEFEEAFESESKFGSLILSIHDLR